MLSVLFNPIIPSLYQIKSSTMCNLYGFLLFCSSVELKLGIDIDEPNQKASVSKVHFMLPPMSQIHPTFPEFKARQVRDEKQC